jgi:hypothetical protein
MTDYPLIFTRQLKEIIGVEAGYSGSDARFTLAIDSASRTLEQILGRKLSKNSYTEYLSTKRNMLKGYDVYGFGDATSGGVYFQFKEVPLYLKNFPIDLNETFQVYYDTNQLWGVETLLDSSCYLIDAERGVLIIKTAVGDYKRSLKVIYTAGYANTVDTEDGEVLDLNASPPQEQALANSIPRDLVQAALFQSQLVYEKQYSGNINVRMSQGQGSTNSVGWVNMAGISPEAMAILMHYKRPRFAVI